MEENNVIKFWEVFYAYFRLIGDDKRMKAGEYLFKKNTSFYNVLKTLKKNKLSYRKITIPECFTITEIINLIKSNPFISGNIDIIPLEGTLFPDTYYFLRNETAQTIIKRMRLKMDKIINDAWNKNIPHLKTKNDLLIMASMIEAEAKIKNEKYLVSSVFHNRLTKGMRLQSDPTVLYEKNLFKKNKNLKIYKKDLLNDNPWNTYTRKGLPKTPICNPGAEAIDAAANPYITNYLYFVSNGEGGHRFSSNLKEHIKNKKIWKNIQNDNN